MSWAARYGRPLGLILVDVDDFKTINDTHGHAVGDVALTVVAEALAEAVRGSDLVARYGGDEFAVVAPETDPVELEALASRLMRAVAEARLHDWDGDGISLRVSAGGAVVTDPTTDEMTLDGLLATADRSLYAAKQAGKGRAGEMLRYGAPEPVAD
jgi:diguanylate cyclase (GGDEF)-like protein